MSETLPVVIVPGIGGSGPQHWQSLWEPTLPGAVRFAPSSWDEPDADDWRDAVRTAIARCPAPPVLVAHSLGCLTAADVARAAPGSVAAALLVAPPDATDPAFPLAAASFRPVDRSPIGVPAVVVHSSDDRYASPAHSTGLAAAWGADPVDAGAVGHVNDASGLGVWPFGREVLDALVASLPRRPPGAL